MTERRWDATRYDSDHSVVWEHAGDLFELLAPRTGEKILDLGCGTGHLMAQIAESGAAVIGVDASAEMVRQASQNYPEILFEVQDAK
jgi:2-polyprenyl-3-methyl-5-hydroxy-6-metoxy-1,4-benzoquinol methylase